MGIEPTLIAWKAIVLPLNYTRAGAERGTWTLTVLLPQDFKSCASTIPPLQHGAPPETRTPDPFIKSEMLYHWASGTIIGWVGWIRTNACQNQNLMPYRLATTQLWWTEVDLNHWNRGWLIYSQLRLAASLSVQKHTKKYMLIYYKL